MKEKNKGFSLIELIIVVAIMAVLVAIIAPNLTKYLSKSKENTDIKNIDQIKSILEQACGLTNTEVCEPDAASNGQWKVLDENTVYFDSDAADVNGLQAFSDYVAEALNDEVPKSKVNGKCFEVKITGTTGDFFTVEVRRQS